MWTRLFREASLTLRVIPLIAAIVLIKLVAHLAGCEFLSVNPLFSGIVAANVFLLGFLLSGVLTDFKESERLPGDLASSLEALADEIQILWDGKRAPEANACLRYLLDVATSTRDWFYKREHTQTLLAKLAGLNAFFLAFEPLTQANFIVRMKQEQSQIRRMLIRIHTIRDTSFIASGYAIAQITIFVLIIGLILARMDPFHESLFFVGIISFLLIYMYVLIRDLDNPFSYYEDGAAEYVSLKPLEDFIRNLEAHLEQDSPRPSTTSDPSDGPL